MFKRMLVIILALMLFLPCAAAEEPAQGVYLLVDRDENGIDTPIGSAVVFQDQSTLLTTAWTVYQQKGLIYALGQGGEALVEDVRVYSAEGGLVLLQLASPVPAQPLGLSTAQTSQESLAVCGHSLQGTAVQGSIAHPAVIPFRSFTALTYTAECALLPGSMLLDDQGQLAGVTLAAYGEGVNRYLALSAADIAATQQETEWLTGFTVTPGTGKLTVDWSSCGLDCAEEDCTLTLFYADIANTFYSTLPLEEGTSADVHLMPGRSYQVWIQHCHGEADMYAARPQESAVSVILPQAAPFALYNYQDAEIYLSSAPIDQAEDWYNKHLPPMEELTPDTLGDASSAIFMQVSSAYTVTQDESAMLLVALTTPEGYAVCSLGEFLFDKTLQQQDLWNFPIYPLLDDYLAFNGTGVFAPGEYSISYYLDGALCNTFTWTME